MNWTNELEFAKPLWLWALLTLPFLWWWIYKTKQQSKASFMLPDTDGLSADTKINYLFNSLGFFRVLAYALLIIVLARPQLVKTKGIDISLVVDVSQSMEDNDIKPNRLEAMKSVVSNFIKTRTSDRVSLIAYSGEALTLVPLTTNYNLLVKEVKSLKTRILEDGTAIGVGLATAINRIKDSKTKSKIVILLTDGLNNTGFISPSNAAQLAKIENIKVYTIGLGATERSSNNLFDFTFGNRHQLDEKLLTDIATTTGGKYFRAIDKNNLEKIYTDIDKLEKSEIKAKKYYNFKEQFHWFLIPAILLLSLEFILKRTLFRGII